jgi:hypothetical protein
MRLAMAKKLPALSPPQTLSSLRAITSSVPQGSAIVPRSKYTVLKSSDRCGHATQGIVAIGNNTGAILTVCTSIECEKHSTVQPRPMPAAFGANPDAEDAEEPNPIQGLRQEGRADQPPPRDFRRIEEKVKEQTAAQLRKEFGEKIFTVPSEDNMELLAFMVAYAVEDYAEDFLTLWKVAPQDEETNVETFEQLLAHLASLSGKEQTAAIFDMLLFSAGGCDAYNYRVSPSVAKAAQLYGVNVEEVETRVRRGIMAQEAPQIPQDQRSESADSEAAAEPGNDATPSPEDQLDEPEMPELQDAEEATATADEAEAQPAEAEEAQQQEEVSSTVAEAEEQPTVNAEAAQGDEEGPAEIEEAKQQEEVASTVAEAEEQPTVNAVAAQDEEEEPAEAQVTPKPPKPRSRAGKGSGRTKRAATTPTGQSRQEAHLQRLNKCEAGLARSRPSTGPGGPMLQFNYKNTIRDRIRSNTTQCRARGSRRRQRRRLKQEPPAAPPAPRPRGPVPARTVP